MDLKKEIEMNTPLVTVAILTYNSQEFIYETINSVINQSFNNWEIVVGDDGSKDGTPTILEHFKQTLGNKMKIVLNKDNKGANENWNSIVPFLKGKYVAKLDGDDLWHPLKLELQVKYMEENEDVVISYHPVFKLFNNKIKKLKSQLIKGKGSDLFIKHGCFACSPSIMVRNSYDLFVPNQLKKVGDWYLWILIGSNGNVGYVNERLAYYRIHNNNVTVKGNKVAYILENIEILNIINKKIKINNELLNDGISNQLFYLASTYFKLGDISESNEYLKKIPKIYKLSLKQKLIKLLIIFNLGKIFKILYKIKKELE